MLYDVSICLIYVWYMLWHMFWYIYLDVDYLNLMLLVLGYIIVDVVFDSYYLLERDYLLE